MKASELIDRLKLTIEEHGDYEVLYSDYWRYAEFVLFIKIEYNVRNNDKVILLS
jgi:hypothetical protein